MSSGQARFSKCIILIGLFEKLEFISEFSQLSCPGQTRTRVA